MAEPAGEYQMKSTGLHYDKTEDGQIKTIRTYEGTATRFGKIYGTLISVQPLVDAGGNSGRCTWVGKALLDDGTLMGGIGEGTIERIGNELRANVSLTHNLSDGGQVRTEGIMDHGAGTFNGHFFDFE